VGQVDGYVNDLAKDDFRAEAKPESIHLAGD
jgi:hypothetical protein